MLRCFFTTLLLLFNAKVAFAFYDRSYDFTREILSRDQCVDFYVLYRPVAPLVNHLFIGAEVVTQNRDLRDESLLVNQKNLYIYGAVKGQSDFDFFKEALNSGDADSIIHAHSACGLEGSQAMLVAREISLDWLEWLTHNIYFYPRIVATPVMGRPCAMAAWEIIEELNNSQGDF